MIVGLLSKSNISGSGIFYFNKEELSSIEHMDHSLNTNSKTFEPLPVSILLINPQTQKFAYIDENAHKSLGYTRNEVLRLKLHDVFVLKTGNGNKKGISDIFLNGDRNCYAIFQKRKDDKLIDTQITLEHITLDDHSYVLCISRANCSKGTDELLREEKNKLQAIIEAMDCGLSIMDKDYNIVYQNKLVNNLFGRVGDKCYRVYEGNERICDGCPVEKAFGDGRSHSSVRTVTMPSGETEHWENTASPIRNAKGDIVSCLEIAKNITEIMKMGKTLCQYQKDWDDIFDIIPDMITVHDMDFNIIRANKAAQKMLDLPFWEHDAELKCFRYYHGTEKPLTGCPSCDCLKTAKPALFEVFEPYLQMYIEIRAIPRFDKDNQLMGLIHVVRDITKRKESEISLKRSKDELNARSQDLNESNQALKVLLRQRENDRAELEEKILSNIEILINPYINKLKKMTCKSNELDYVHILESNLRNMTSSFSKKLSSRHLALTHREIQIAKLIKEGKQSKDIAEMMNISLETTNCHRQNIRKKLGLKNAKVNLRAYLMSLDD